MKEPMALPSKRQADIIGNDVDDAHRHVQQQQL